MRVLLRSLLVTLLPLTCAYAQSLDSSRYQPTRFDYQGACGPQPEASLPRYQPGESVSGTIRIWGNPRMAGVTKLWEEGFRSRQPGVSFETRLKGTDAAMAGLYGGVADLALMGREATLKERMAFEYVYRYQPTRIEIATGSVDLPEHSPALVAFVHKDNPLARLTLAQLDAAFSHERRRGDPAVLTWDQLGLGGDWAGRPINLYTYDLESGTGSYFRQAVLRDSYKLNWDHLREFTQTRPSDGPTADGGRLIVDAVAGDRFGLGVSTPNHASPVVKPLTLANEDSGPWFAATRETVLSRQYPLSRAITAWVNRVSGQPIAPAVREFLRYIVSDEGQNDVAREGGFLPLCPEIAGTQLGSAADRHFWGVPVHQGLYYLVAPPFRKEEQPR
jgi:phosphate transport system substrate-binding protein